jgi:hypothetical protein
VTAPQNGDVFTIDVPMVAPAAPAAPPPAKEPEKPK